MLPSELLSIIRWQNNVRPKYSKFDKGDFSAAEAIIKVYLEGIGLRRGEIRRRVTELEDAYGSFKFIRGLSTLVERKCTFTSKTIINPLEARHILFSEASKRGYPVDLEDRQRIFELVASKLNVSVEQLEASMYADLETEMILESVPKINPVELLKEYNLSLTQTLLFHATEMMFTASGNWQRIFRAIKYYGLMYMVEKRNDQFMVKIDGPISLFKLTRRYGTALAKVLPEIFIGKPWRIEAKILRGNRLFNFTLDSSRHGWLFPEIFIEERYDSMIEEEFATQFRSLGLPWIIKREAEPIEVGASIMIPDFTLQIGRTRILMEIVGFWTKEYMRRKIEKLAKIRNIPFIIAVDEELVCDKITNLKTSNPNIHIIQYKGKIPIIRVLEILKPYAEAEVENQTMKLKLNVEKPIITLRELAEKHGVLIEAVRRAAEKLETHILIGETLIERKIMEEISKTLKNMIKSDTPLPKVIKALENFSLPDPITAIKYCGFQIKWQGLRLEDAIVQKPKEIH